MNITLRPVRESDDSFLFTLYASTRAAEMALVPWTNAQKQGFVQMQFTAQKTSYAKQYPGALHAVICRNGDPVGRVYLDKSKERFHILDITIAEACRNQGIGSVVLREILEEAQEAGKPTTIYVETFNPCARLFERLGFRTASVKDVMVLLERGQALRIDAFGRPYRRGAPDMTDDRQVSGCSRRYNKQRKSAERVMFQFISPLLQCFASPMEVKRKGVNENLGHCEGLWSHCLHRSLRIHIFDGQERKPGHGLPGRVNREAAVHQGLESPLCPRLQVRGAKLQSGGPEEFRG